MQGIFRPEAFVFNPNNPPFALGTFEKDKFVKLNDWLTIIDGHGGFGLRSGLKIINPPGLDSLVMLNFVCPLGLLGMPISKELERYQLKRAFNQVLESAYELSIQTSRFVYATMLSPPAYMLQELDTEIPCRVKN